MPLAQQLQIALPELLAVKGETPRPLSLVMFVALPLGLYHVEL
jgi:hypothetical protein